MEIEDSNTVIFYTSRAFGLAPFLIRRTPKGRIAEFVLSVLLCGYSVAVLLALGECARGLGTKWAYASSAGELIDLRVALVRSSLRDSWLQGMRAGGGGMIYGPGSRMARISIKRHAELAECLR